MEARRYRPSFIGVVGFWKLVDTFIGVVGFWKLVAAFIKVVGFWKLGLLGCGFKCVYKMVPVLDLIHQTQRDFLTERPRK